MTPSFAYSCLSRARLCARQWSIGMLLAGGVLSTASVAAPSEPELTEVIVTATLRPMPARSLSASVSVLDARTLSDAGQQHFEDVLGLIPNLNWAGDTSRPRYFQLRGIGELEQYQGAPNSSIGFLVDDIDFSGLGSVATTFDVDHIEVLRGPQGTRYGANALGGLIYVTSAAPEDAFAGRLEFGAGNYNARSAGAVVTGPVAALDSSFRLAVQRATGDGYYHNVFLNRYDTNGRDELTLRGKWRYQPTERLRIDLSALHVQIDNGYDAFAPDNTRITHSDKPSVDAQHSTGGALRLFYAGPAAFDVTGVATYADTRSTYGYDGDWGNATYWAPYVNDFTDIQTRRRQTGSVELRLASTPQKGFAWLFGLYAQQLRETLEESSIGNSDDPINGPYAQHTLLGSGYRARSYALFGVLDGDFTDRLRWSIGLRGERRTASYHERAQDLLAGESLDTRFRLGDRLWGGHTSLSYRITPRETAYLQLARGYKAGGFNLSQGLTPDETLFRPESDWNLEVGYKADLADRRLTLATDLFALYRQDAQIKSSVQTDPNNPNLFVYYTGNAASGANYGFEASVDWRAMPGLTLGTSIGLLQTHFRDFTRSGNTGTTTVSRALANAPSWQAAAHAVWRHPRGAFARLDVTGMGAYYFDLPPNDTRSRAYALLHLKLGWETERWSAYLYGRNLLNKDYPVRGFFFGLEPPYYPNKLYLQLGDPHAVGANVIVRFGTRR